MLSACGICVAVLLLKCSQRAEPRKALQGREATRRLLHGAPALHAIGGRRLGPIHTCQHLAGTKLHTNMTRLGCK